MNFDVFCVFSMTSRYLKRFYEIQRYLCIYEHIQFKSISLEELEKYLLFVLLQNHDYDFLGVQTNC